MQIEATPSKETEPGYELTQSLEQWRLRLDRLEADTTSDTSTFPEWWYEGNIQAKILSQCKEYEPDLGAVTAYYGLFAREATLRESITGFPLRDHPIKQVIYNLGGETIGRALRAESNDGILHGALLDDIKATSENGMGVLTTELDVLRHAYDVNSFTELLGINGDEYTEELRDALLSDAALRWIRYSDEARSDTYEDTQAAAQGWMSEAVVAATGIDLSEAFDYVFTASRRGKNEDIISIIHVFDVFGVDRIRKLTQITGIRGLEGYSIQQLERMEELIEQPGEVAERLAAHDVQVVLINRVGDHNGVLHDSAALFDDVAARTLFLEIDSLSDAYRRMSLLHKLGIRPSTLVLAAHSAPGQFMISDAHERDTTTHSRDVITVAGRALVRAAMESPDRPMGDSGYAIHGMKGSMARLVEAYMQPSSAIDDAAINEGRKKIIFQACNAASEVEVKDVDQQGKKVTLGVESVISQLGSDLLAMGVQSSVDIYGAPGGIQTHRTSRGVHYSGQPGSFDEALIGRPHLSAQRIRLEGGKLAKSEVHDIVLRK
jgi:hypothetical protein